MSAEKLIDKMILEAIARGEFDNLEGKGKPLDLDSYFATPEDLRMGYSVLKSNKFVPEEVDWLREIGELREKIAFCTNETEKDQMTKMLRDKELALTLILERNKQRK